MKWRKAIEIVTSGRMRYDWTPKSEETRKCSGTHAYRNVGLVVMSSLVVMSI